MNPKLELAHVSFAYGDRFVLKDISYALETNKRYCLMGPSGCGKTTLLYLVLGLLKPGSGSVCGLPQDTTVVFQENRLFESFSVWENLYAVFPRGHKPQKSQVIPLLEAMALEAEILDKKAGALSGGMKRRLCLVRALLPGPSFVIMDEPFAGLDLKTKAEVMDGLGAYLGQDTGLIFTTHDPQDAEALQAQILKL